MPRAARDARQTIGSLLCFAQRRGRFRQAASYVHARLSPGRQKAVASARRRRHFWAYIVPMRRL